MFRLFRASAAPRSENSNSGEKDAVFGLKIYINFLLHFLSFEQFKFILC
jgi:hypothetical protein